MYLKDIVQELECSICLEYMVPPIPMCENGHSVCNTYRQKLMNCPVCRGRFSNTRCFLLENVTRKIRCRCKYYSRGCPRLFDLRRIKRHEDDCRHQPFKCPLAVITNARCSWEGSVTAMKHHIQDEHKRLSDEKIAIRENNGRLMCNESDSQGTWYKAIFSKDKTFFMLPRIIENNMHICVLHVGARDKASDYTYKVTLLRQDGAADVSVWATTASYLSDVDAIFSKQECAVFQPDCWKKCLDAKKNLACAVEIFKDVKK